MTVYVIVSIKDRAIGFGRPAFVPSEGSAIRSFQDEINNNQPNNEMNRHPDDFDLYQLGTFDDSSGQFVCPPSPQQIAIGKQLKLPSSSSNG